MYMFVLVTLIVAIMGIYTQVFNLQTARTYAQQSSVAQSMLDWHTTAAALSQNIVQSAAVTASPILACSLTKNFTASNYPSALSLNYCYKTGPTNIYLPDSGAASLTPQCSATQTSPCYTAFPPGNITTALQFFSIAYNTITPSQSFVLTFVPPPASAGGLPAFVCLPGGISPTACTGQQIDIVLADLMLQIQRRGISPFGYGTAYACTVSATCPTGVQLTTPPVPGSNGSMTTLSYQVPNFVPAGSIGVISQINLCPNC